MSLKVKDMNRVDNTTLKEFSIKAEEQKVRFIGPKTTTRIHMKDNSINIISFTAKVFS
jgi:hypothetical protein